jgi:hypothetical protein
MAAGFIGYAILAGIDLARHAKLFYYCFGGSADRRKRSRSNGSAYVVATDSRVFRIRPEDSRDSL